MKKYFVVLLATLSSFSAFAGNDNKNTNDTVNVHFLDEIIITTSTKETNDLKTLPAAVSLITPQMIEGQKIISVKDLSMIVPNLYLHNYGSRLSTPVYIRGIGERSSGQSVGMYVDNMPYMDKSVFDFDFVDIQRIEVLRGPQGTLYGRNAMSGIINVYTNPALSDYTKVSLSAGNYGLFRTKASIARTLNKDMGVSVGGYYDRNDGFFTNNYTGKKADKLSSAGGRIRFDWKLSPNWKAFVIGSYDYSDQGAFPYGAYEDGNIAKPDYNAPGAYRRETANTNLNLEYKDEHILFNSSTGFLFFQDRMAMDTDYSARDSFDLIQKQIERSWTQEFTIKSNHTNNYQWSFGVFGFYNNLHTASLTRMGQGGINGILQPVLDGLTAGNPYAPTLTVTDSEINIPGMYKTPSYGGAIFHQSTYNNLFVEGLSLTAGVRLDYEKTKLDYNSDIEFNLSVKPPFSPVATASVADTALIGREKMSFTEFLPKVALKYEINRDHYIYGTVANGYKTGGYNIQSFADVVQNAIISKYANTESPSVKEAVSYKPEYSWNYEVGYKGELVKNRLYADVAAFLIQVKDIQITDFVESGQGRILKNAGKARSLGAEISLTALITNEFRVSANYGLTKATFTDYQIKDSEGNIITDYNDNYIPFAPQNTFSVSAVYNKRFSGKAIDGFNVQAQYNAAGKIYWTEENDVHQKLYGILNLKASISKGIFNLALWTNNTLDQNYTVFYFESMDGTGRAQKGKPFTFGIDLSCAF